MENEKPTPPPESGAESTPKPEGAAPVDLPPNMAKPPGEPGVNTPKTLEPRAPAGGPDQPSETAKSESAAPAKPAVPAAAKPPGETPAKPTGTAPPKPEGATPAKPAGAAPPPRPAPPPPKPPESLGAQEGLVNNLKATFGDAILEAKAYLGQVFLSLKPSAVLTVCRYLKETPETGYNYLVDITAVDYPNKPKRFEMIYVLYSHTRNDRLILKAQLEKTEAIASVTGLWSTANWLEREVYDMFGVEFTHHPDLKRILLPDGWHGFPLRKDYPIALQDEEWIKANLDILK